MPWTAGSVLTAALMNIYVPQTWSTWTPVMSAASGTLTTVSGAGRYISVGQTVFWRASITITSAGTGAGALRFTLPTFAAFSTGHIGAGRDTAGSAGTVVATLFSTSVGQVVSYNNSTPIASGNQIEISGFYERP